MEKRHSWPSQFIYILAAVGCAAGLGNLWRFPMLAYEYGGAAFIIALILSNIVIVFPLMMFETIVGQRAQAGPPKSMEALKKGTGWIQWLGTFGILGILIYYVPVLGWGINYLGESLSGNFLNNPSEYFVTDILGLSSGIQELGSLQIPLLISVTIAYIMIILSLRKGIQSMSKVIHFTAIAPFIILFIFIIRGITLPGASEGLRAFFIPDWQQLGNITLWKEAISQSFFSASLAMGYFMYAGGHRAKNAEVARSSLWIIAGNFFVSFLSGIAVFSTLGFMAQQQGVPISEAATGGPMLVFSVLPTAISMMPTFKIGFAVLLFLTVATLAIDSIFGMFELAVASFMDIKKKYEGHFQTFLSVIVITFILGIPICFGAGLYFLDIMDHFISGYILTFIGMLECIVASYMVGANTIRKWINETTNLKIGKWFNVVMNVLPIILGILLLVTLKKEFEIPYEGYPMWALYSFGVFPLALIGILSAIFHQKTKSS